MKNRKSGLLLAVMLISAGALLFNCPVSPGDRNGELCGLDTETQNRIIQALIDSGFRVAEDVRITGFYGTFNNVITFTFTCSNTWHLSIHGTVAAGILFVYNRTPAIRAWDGNEFYPLHEAYRLGLLSRDDIKTINERHRAKFPLYYEEFERREIDKSRLGRFEDRGLSAEAELRILKDFARHMTDTNRFGIYLTVDVYLLVGYYGTYNGSIVVSRDSATPFFGSYCFGGIFIHTIGDKRFFVWKEGRIYTLPEAWDSELLTRADMQSIAEIHSARIGLDFWCQLYPNCDYRCHNPGVPRFP